MFLYGRKSIKYRKMGMQENLDEKKRGLAALFL